MFFYFLVSCMTKMKRGLDWLIDEQYVPSSVERKKAVLMYFFVWIVAALSKESLTIYEMFHLKQSIGRWMIFFMSMIGWILFVFIPYLWILPVLFFLLFVFIWIIFTKQAREGAYVIDEDKILMPFFAWIWGWVVSIFDLDIGDEEIDESIEL